MIGSSQLHTDMSSSMWFISRVTIWHLIVVDHRQEKLSLLNIDVGNIFLNVVGLILMDDFVWAYCILY